MAASLAASASMSSTTALLMAAADESETTALLTADSPSDFGGENPATAAAAAAPPGKSPAAGRGAGAPAASFNAVEERLEMTTGATSSSSLLSMDELLEEDESSAPGKSQTAGGGGGGGGNPRGAAASKLEETSLSIGLQVLLPFSVAGLGMVGAGMVLDIVQHWPVFVDVNQLFILVPALLGLKGNLEMTLAARLSTQAHLGGMDGREAAASVIVSNLALIQVQGIVIGFVASAFAMAMGWITKQDSTWQDGMVVCASAVSTASMASLILGAIMVAVVMLSKRFRINPDNVATPIAASLGDLVTLTILAYMAAFLHRATKQSSGGGPWAGMAPSIMALYAILIAPFAVLARRNPTASEALRSGWVPVLTSMIISSLGGMILDKAVSKFRGIAVFQPVFNGVGGNLVAVQASRTSTYLFVNSKLGVLPNGEQKVCLDPLSILFGKRIHSRSCRVLLFLSIPGHVCFALLISKFNAGHTTLTPSFYALYLSAAFVQIWILLCCAHWMVFAMWRGGIDPDNASIPYLTALGDFLGGALLLTAFEILFQTDGENILRLGDKAAAAANATSEAYLFTTTMTAPTTDQLI